MLKICRSSLTFGRARTLPMVNSVPLPARRPTMSASLDAFISLCELVTILNGLQRVETSVRPCGCRAHEEDPLERLAAIGFFFDEWKTGVDARGLFTTCDAGSDGPPPGVRSLNLIYLGSVLMVVRETWNHAGTDDPAVQIACQKACLKACEDIVDFVCGLGHDDLRGYWSSRLSITDR